MFEMFERDPLQTRPGAGDNGSVSFLERPGILLALCLAMTALVGFIDYLLGYNLSMTLFYVFPVVLACWGAGKIPGILVSAMSATEIWLTDEMSRPPSIHPFIPIWRGATALCFFLLIVWLVTSRKEDMKRRIRMTNRLQELAVTEERNRVADEIHDTMAQGCTGVVVHLEAALDSLPQDPQEAVRHIEQAQAQARGSLRDVRRAIRASHPPELAEQGLAEAVRDFVERMAVGTATSLALSLKGKPYRLPSEVRFELLRICQEAVVNAIRHAKPGKIAVCIAYNPSEVRLSIEDDGVGFDPASASGAAGCGLISMSRRAERIGAQFEVRSEPGAGTTVAAFLRAQDNDMEVARREPS